MQNKRSELRKAEMTIEKITKNTGPALIILAAFFWGSMGIFVRAFSAYGFSSVQIVAIRVTIAALFFAY